MTPVTFKRPNPYAEDKTIIIEKILYWERTGEGSRIVFEDKTSIMVGNYPHEIESMIQRAKNGKDN